MLSSLLTKSPDADHQVALDREVRERLDAHRPGQQVAQEGLARELRLAVDHHPAAAADRHAARPAEAQRPVELVLDVLQPLQHRHVVGERHVVALPDGLGLLLRPVAQHLDLDPLVQAWAASFLALRLLARGAVGARARLRGRDLTAP